LAWSNKNKNKNKTKTKLTTVAATSPPLCLQTATPMLPLLLPLRKQSQQRRQHGLSSGSSSSRVIAAAAHYFELPCYITLVLPAQQVGCRYFLVRASRILLAQVFCWRISKLRCASKHQPYFIIMAT
jgi:hypothetical protein